MPKIATNFDKIKAQIISPKSKNVLFCIVGDILNHTIVIDVRGYNFPLKNKIPYITVESVTNFNKYVSSYLIYHFANLNNTYFTEGLLAHNSLTLFKDPCRTSQRPVNYKLGTDVLGIKNDYEPAIIISELCRLNKPQPFSS